MDAPRSTLPASSRSSTACRCCSTSRTRTAGSPTPTAPRASSSAGRPRRSSGGCRRSSSTRSTVERWAAQNREVLRTGRPIDIEDGWGERTPPDAQDAGVRRRGPAGRGDRPLDRHHASASAPRRRCAAARRGWPRRSRSPASARGTGTRSAREVTWSAELRRMLRARPGDASRSATRRSISCTPTTASVVAEASRTAMRARRDDGARAADAPRRRRATGCCSAAAARRWAPDGTARRFDGICEDVTERRHAEERLAEAQRLGADRLLRPRPRGRRGGAGRPRRTASSASSPSTTCRRARTCSAMVVDEDRERLRGEVDARDPRGRRRSTASSRSGAPTASCATCASAAPCTAPAAGRAT